MFRSKRGPRGTGLPADPAAERRGSRGSVAAAAASWPEQPGTRFGSRTVRTSSAGTSSDSPSRGILSREDAVQQLVWAAEVRDDETARHIEQMSRYCYALAVRAGLGFRQAAVIQRASRLHDIGKICIPRAILLKPERLTEAEMDVVRRHTTIGHSILSGSGVEWLDVAATIALTHHEHFDGSGYPNHLSGNEIPFVGRIAAIADVFDALTSRRPYKSALPTETAVDIMMEGRGKQFDPSALDLFVRSLDDVLEIKAEPADTLVRSPRGTLVACFG